MIGSLPKFVEQWLDLVIPKLCIVCQAEGHYWCRLGATAWPLCFWCRTTYHPNRPCEGRRSLPLITVGPYHDETLRQLIYQWKYHGCWAISHDWANDIRTQIQLFINEPIQLMPIPLHPSRQRSRGYNQAWILANQIHQLTAWELTTCLTRIRATVPQATLTSQERFANLKDSFVVTSPIGNQSIWLVDDIITSGATIRAAQTALMKHKIGVQGIISIAWTQDSND